MMIQELNLKGNRTDIINLESRIGKAKNRSATSDPPLNQPRLDEGGLITLDLEVGSRTFLEPLTLHGFKASDSISEVKARVCQEATNLDWRPLDLHSGLIVTAQGRHLEDNEDLASLFYPGCRDLNTTLYYIEKEEEEESKEKNNINWFSVCKHVRFTEEAHEEDNKDYYKHNSRPISIVKRPKTIHAPLPVAELSELGIHGPFSVIAVTRQSIPPTKLSVSEIMNDIPNAIPASVHVGTNASVILLAPTDKIFKYLVHINSEHIYLVVRVYWDRLSYIFLRTLRASYPNIPIVAVTDLDPHHLDVLTFLDTPRTGLLNCYGWDLDFDHGNSINMDDFLNIDFLNIQWLGLRPDDCQKLLSFDGAAPPPPGFCEVIRMLRANPFLRRKKDWLEALDVLNAFGKSVSLQTSASAESSGVCYPQLGDDFIFNKLSKEDWV